jgi:hypothetical protein
MKVCFTGLMEQAATFEAAQGVAAGQPVKVTESGKVSPCAENDIPCGVAMNVHGEYAAVQLAGYVKVPYTGNVAVGYQKIAANGAGGVTVSDTGRQLLNVDIDTTASVCGILL